MCRVSYAVSVKLNAIKINCLLLYLFLFSSNELIQKKNSDRIFTRSAQLHLQLIDKFYGNRKFTFLKIDYEGNQFTLKKKIISILNRFYGFT